MKTAVKWIQFQKPASAGFFLEEGEVLCMSASNQLSFG